MLLFHDIDEICALPDSDGRLVYLVVAVNNCRVAPTHAPHQDDPMKLTAREVDSAVS